MLYLFIIIIVIILFIIGYTWFFTKSINNIMNTSSSKIVLYFNTPDNKIIKSFSKLKKYISIDIIQDKTYQKPTVIYYNNSNKYIYPENLKIKYKNIVSYFALK